MGAVATASDALDLERAWGLHPQVALRPESWGALAYHFGTRRLTFLKSSTLRQVVQTLDESPTGLDACRAAGISDDALPQIARALGTLAATDMIVARST